MIITPPLETHLVNISAKKKASHKGKLFKIDIEVLYYLAKKSLTLALGTISSLKEYDPVLGDLTILITLA